MGNHALGIHREPFSRNCTATSALMNPSKPDVNGNTSDKLIKVASCSECSRGIFRRVRDAVALRPVQRQLNGCDHVRRFDAVSGQCADAPLPNRPCNIVCDARSSDSVRAPREGHSWRESVQPSVDGCTERFASSRRAAPSVAGTVIILPAMRLGACVASAG
jgi:hypothetical protein